MIIAYDAVLGYANIIVFQLAERIALAEKSMRAVLGHCIDMLGFSYNAIPTRHEAHEKPYPLRRNDRDRRCRSEARRLEHSLVCERSGVRILPLR